ncbi:MAG: hypothetical protein KDA65_05735 [Planctomycetaceae bacterium]|nr:hypothetical protein [Planctomycetaceae bacterium]
MKRLMLCSALIASLFFVGGEVTQSNEAKAGDGYRHHRSYRHHNGWNRRGWNHNNYYRGRGYYYSPYSYYPYYGQNYYRGNGFYYSGPGFSFGIYD